MSDNPAPSAYVVEPLQPTSIHDPQPDQFDMQSTKAPSERSTKTKISRSSCNVKAKKAALEALTLRRRFEREQELAAREREREQELAAREREREQELAAREREREQKLEALQRQVEDSEMQAELTSIEADDISSCEVSLSRHHNSSKVSIINTKNWVENQNVNSVYYDVNTGTSTATKAAAFEEATFINPSLSKVKSHVIKASEAVGVMPPLISTELLTQKNSHLQTVADTAAASHNVVEVSEAAGGLPPLISKEQLSNDTSSLLQAAKALTSAANAKKLRLIPFFGNILHWLSFKRTYDITKSGFSPLENIMRLQNAVRGPAREAVAALLMSTEDPEEVMRALEDNFARPELIVYREVTNLKNLPRLGNDLKELGTISNRVRNSVSTIKLLKQIEYLYSPELFHSVLGKLNYTIKIRWTDFAKADITGRPKLEMLSDFLISELDQHMRYSLSPESSLAQSQHFHPERQFVTNVKREHVNSFTYVKTDRTDRVSSKHQQQQQQSSKCSFCKKDHNIKSCNEFKSLTVDDRWEWLREAKVCYRCLKRSSHQWKTCKVNPCGTDGCSLRHHPLLHQKPHANITKTLDAHMTDNHICTVTSDQYTHPSLDVSDTNKEKVVVSTTSTSAQQPNTILTLRPRAYLKMIPVTVSGPAGSCNVYALLDDGSTATLIDSSIAKHIGATGPQQTITVNGIGGLERSTTISYVDFYIKGRHTEETFFIRNARAMDSLSLRPQTIQREIIDSFSHLVNLGDVLSYEDATPTILIGAEHWHLSINRSVRFGKKNEPVACLTALGWTLYGVASSKTKLVDFVNYGTFVDEISDDDKLEFLIKEYYKIDSLGISKKETLHCKRDQRAVDILETTSRRLPTGRFEVGMPWRDDIQRIPDSYPQALSRFLSLEKSMGKDDNFAKAYQLFMENMVSKGYAEECTAETYYTKGIRNLDNLRFYLPHFGVYHPQKHKIRVVHDAAAMNEGVSLNSLLLSGPDLLQPLLKILFCFREGRIAMIADIREMFPQIRIREQDRDALRYLWRPKRTQPIKEFRMTSVIFGACCSPFVAQYIKNKNAQDHKDLYPKAVNAILYNHYMDDYIDSLDDVDESAQLAADIITVHSAACFEIRGWVSNESAALKFVPSHLRATQNLEIDLGNTQALGIVWNPNTDNLGFRTGLSDVMPSPLTKRKVLSHLMRVYDPLGLLGPIIVKGRILFQQAWRLNIDWDTELPQIEASKWSDWFQELMKVSSLKIPRWYSRYKGSEPSFRELHVFADASELAYACVAYWRLLYPDGSIKLALISSKARVSPLKPTSIPRLELQAALIASRLALTIKNSHRIKPVRTFLWSDSMTVLQWLRSDARSYKPFVAHRLGEILENSSIKDWRWVPTDLNVADDATKMHQINLDLTHRWFVGPSFLFKFPEDWPSEPASVAPVREEYKNQGIELVGLTCVGLSLPTPVTAHFNHFSDWLRLLRATARVHQAATIIGKKLDTIRNSKLTGDFKFNSRHLSTSTTLLPLNADLMKAAERHILQQTQIDSFPEEFHCILNSKPIPLNSRLRKLSPTLGEDMLLHLAGRIQAVEDIDPDTRFPVLIDGRHPVVRLLVEFYHRQAGHANHELVINELRQKFWLLRLRNTVRTVAKQCLFCRIRNTRPLNPVTGNLPKQRLSHHQRPFTFTGIDYFGPITITIGRRHEKRYVALFTCLTSRALHLELVHSLSADSAIMALRRFIARRGTPDTIFSDNGTAFVGANRILKEFYTADVQDFTTNKGIKWSFIPAAAPTFGGCWERLVRTVKVALKATLNEKAPKEETLITLIAEAEAIVNSRPLTHVSTDLDDPTTLTPFHFLIGSSSNQLLPTVLDNRDLISRSEWRRALRLADHFWNRWVREVLPTMQPRTQTKGTDGQALQIGDVVVIVDESLPRGTWPRGRIHKMYPGKDGITRVVDVATVSGLLRRPLKKLVKLAT